MDFSRVDLSPEDQEFFDHTRALIAQHVTEEVLRRDRETGENFSEPVHLALGDAGYLASDFKLESEGGFDPVYMSALFDYARVRARQGFPWLKAPPHLTPSPVD